MRLNYKEANSELINRQEAKRGYAVLKLDKNHVGELIRLQESLEPVNENEIVLKYKTINGRLFLNCRIFFLKKDRIPVYNRAAYGGLRVDNKGQSLLVGLYDRDFRQIKAMREQMIIVYIRKQKRMPVGKLAASSIEQILLEHFPQTQSLLFQIALLTLFTF